MSKSPQAALPFRVVAFKQPGFVLVRMIIVSLVTVGFIWRRKRHSFTILRSSFLAIRLASVILAVYFYTLKINKKY